MKRNHLKSSFTTKEHSINSYTSTQWEIFDQLSRIKMLSLSILEYLEYFTLRVFSTLLHGIKNANSIPNKKIKCDYC